MGGLGGPVAMEPIQIWSKLPSLPLLVATKYPWECSKWRKCLFWNSSTGRCVWSEYGDWVVGGLVLQWKIIDTFSIVLGEKGFSCLQALILLTGG